MVDAGNTYYDTVKLIQEKLIVHGLKNILKQLRISSTGRKAHLQSRLIDYISAALRRDDGSRIEQVHNMVLEELNMVVRPTTASSAPVHPNASASAASTQQQELHQQLARVEFNKSPFYVLEQMLGNPLLLPITLRDMPTKLSMAFEVNFEQLSPGASYDVLLLSTMYPFVTQEKSIMQFPLQFDVRVNQQQLQLNGFRGVKGKPGTAKAQILTGLVSSYHKNLIEITVNDVPQFYGMFVYLAKNVPLDSLLNRIELHQHISKESTVQQIINENNQDNDDDIQTLSTILSLKCPLSYCRINTPVRSIHCKHIECFDAKSFLQLQQQATTWTCPICNKILDFDSLAVDDYLHDILRILKNDETDEIEIDQNGGWKIKLEDSDEPHINNNNNNNNNNKNNETTTYVKREQSGELAGRDSENVEIISLSDSDEEEDNYRDLQLPRIAGDQSRIQLPPPIPNPLAPIADPDLFSSLPDWENSMFNRRSGDGPPRNGSTSNSLSSISNASTRQGGAVNYNGYSVGTNGGTANTNRSWLPPLSTLVSQQQNQRASRPIELDNVIDLTLSDDDD